MKATLAWLLKLLNDCITENDGQSVCPVRVVGLGLIVPSELVFLYASALRAHAGTLDLMGFAEALGVMIGGVTTLFSAAIAVKAMTDARPPGPAPSGPLQ